LNIKEIGVASKYKIIEIECDCGRKEYAIMDRWDSLIFKSLQEIASLIKSLAMIELKESQRPYIRKWKREAYMESSKELFDLARKLEENLNKKECE
jgi:hypothetical protein